MKRWIHAASKNYRSLENRVRGVISWNNYFYGFVPYKSGTKYYKSRTVRFDDSMGGTEEVSVDEYNKYAEKFAKVIH